MWCTPVDHVGRVDVGQAAGHIGRDVGAASAPAVLLAPWPIKRSTQVATLRHSRPFAAASALYQQWRLESGSDRDCEAMGSLCLVHGSMANEPERPTHAPA